MLDHNWVKMKSKSFKIEIAVCALVTAAFTNIYITQPILPVLEAEFDVTTAQVSLTVSFVILGIVLSNLFFGYLSDRIPIRPILCIGGFFVTAGGMVCAMTNDFEVLVGARTVQGLFIPALTTSLAAWLSKNLPQERLSVVMGTYVAATVLGGLGGAVTRWMDSSASGLAVRVYICSCPGCCCRGSGRPDLTCRQQPR